MKKRTIFAALSVLSVMTVYAANGDGKRRDLANARHDGTAIEQEAVNGPKRYEYIESDGTTNSSSDTKSYMEVTLTAAGTLAEALGSYRNGIDTLVVNGPINSDDFKTMWSSSRYGRLSVINIANTQVDGGKIPANAFFHPDEQITTSSGIYVVKLSKIQLPDNITEIGNGAFSYAVHLAEITLPPSLKYIGEDAFTFCESLSADCTSFLPESLQEIGDYAFSYCKSLTGKMLFPASLRRIGEMAFAESKLSDCEFREGLEYLGNSAFYVSTNLKSALLPNSCKTLDGSRHFTCNYTLEKLHVPESVTGIPSRFAYLCVNLKEVNIPSGVEKIGSEAFLSCSSLESLSLPEGLKTIESDALKGLSSITTITLPSTLESIGSDACSGWSSINSIYCAAKVPPVCEAGNAPFGAKGSRTTIMPLYVPVGSALLYRNASGWSEFTNIIEVDDSVLTSINGVEAGTTSDGSIYDMQGRKVLRPQKGQIYIKAGQKFIQAE